MPVEDKLKQQLDFIKKYKKMDANEAQKLIDDQNSLSNQPNPYAQLLPNSFDSSNPNPLAKFMPADQIQYPDSSDDTYGSDHTQPKEDSASLAQPKSSDNPIDLSRPAMDNIIPMSTSGLPPYTPDMLARTAGKKDTSNMVGTDDSDGESNLEDDNDTYQNPLTAKEKGEPIDASSLLGLTKNQQPSNFAPVQANNSAFAKPDQFDQELANARQADAQHQLLFGMMKASQMAGSALGQTGKAADTSYADSELGRANANVTNLKTSMDMKEENANIQEKKQKRDPTSKTSLLYQQMLSELNPDIDTAGLSAEQVEKIFPQIGTIIAHRETAENMRLKNEGLLLSKKELADKKLENTIEKEKTALDTHLTSQTKGRSGAVQGAIAQKMRGESINQMFENLPRKADGSINFGAAGVAHKEELIKGIDLMLSGGRSSIGGTEHLRQAYGTGLDKLTAIRQKLSLGKLPELGEEKIIQQMYDLMNRESDVARLQAGKGLGASISTGFQHTSPEDKRAAIAKISDVSPAEQELMMDKGATVTNMMELKRQGISPEDALALLRTGKKLPEILKGSSKSTTISTPAQSGLVTIRSKQSGKTKTLTAESAAKYLNDPAFERVQ